AWGWQGDGAGGTKGGGPPDGDEHGRPRRQGHFRRRRASGEPDWMTARISRRFASLKDEGRAALVTFLMAGDPDEKTSLEIVCALPQAGADVIELGMPFTGPMADGPALQAARLRAPRARPTLKKKLGIVRHLPARDHAPPI